MLCDLQPHHSLQIPISSPFVKFQTMSNHSLLRIIVLRYMKGFHGNITDDVSRCESSLLSI